MKWNSEEGRNLLRQAFPDGYLSVRGVSTLGGWMSLGSSGDIEGVRRDDEELFLNVPLAAMYGYRESNGFVASYGAADPWSGKPFTQARERGDLLPNPEDPATWTLLKRELASCLASPTSNFGTATEHVWDGVGCRWTLTAVGASTGRACAQVFTIRQDFQVGHPRSALLRALIQCREKKR